MRPDMFTVSVGAQRVNLPVALLDSCLSVSLQLSNISPGIFQSPLHFPLNVNVAPRPAVVLPYKTRTLQGLCLRPAAQACTNPGYSHSRGTTQSLPSAT